MSRVLGISAIRVQSLAANLKIKHATEFSAVAFVREFGLDFSRIVKDTYLRLDLSVIRPDPVTLEVLSNLKGEKIVFTANPAAFAQYTLEYLGFLTYFNRVIGMEEVEFVPKDDQRAYRIVQELIQSSAGNIYFCDDTIRNLNAARRLGWTTIWYCPKGEHGSDHLIVRALSELLGL